MIIIISSSSSSSSSCRYYMYENVHIILCRCMYVYIYIYKYIIVVVITTVGEAARAPPADGVLPQRAARRRDSTTIYKLYNRRMVYDYAMSNLITMQYLLRLRGARRRDDNDDINIDISN